MFPRKGYVVPWNLLPALRIGMNYKCHNKQTCTHQRHSYDMPTHISRKQLSRSKRHQQIGYPFVMLWSETYQSHFPSVSVSTRRNAICCLRARFSDSDGLDVLTHACQNSKCQHSFSKTFALDTQKDKTHIQGYARLWANTQFYDGIPLTVLLKKIKV